MRFADSGRAVFVAHSHGGDLFSSERTAGGEGGKAAW